MPSASNRAFPRRPPDERRPQGRAAPEQGAVQRAHRDQPVLPARPHVRQLGPEEARGVREERVDRRDEARRPPDRAHPLSRRASQPPGPRQAANRRERARGAESRSAAGAPRAPGAPGGDRLLRDRQGLREPRALRRHPQGRGRAHRLARDPDRSRRQPRRPELAAIGRRLPLLACALRRPREGGEPVRSSSPRRRDPVRPSSPRRRGPRLKNSKRRDWVPACAGTTIDRRHKDIQVNAGFAKRVGRRMKQPVVYILASEPYGTLYIGVTSNLAERIEAHRNGSVDGFTKEYGVHALVYFEMHDGMYEAIQSEKRLKKWNRAWKVKLIEEMNPEWKDLSAQAFKKTNGAPAFAGTTATR